MFAGAATIYAIMTRTIFASTLHDPTGGMAPFVQQYGAQLRALYADAVVVATPGSSAETVQQFRNHNFRVHTDATVNVGESRRLVVKRARQRNADFIHYCDADRAIKWIMDYPDELAGVVEQVVPELAFCAFGRTERAFETHPIAQKETEYISNRVFSWLFGETEKILDVVAGSCSLSRDAAKIILEESTALSNGTDAEWPMIIDQLTDGDIAFLNVEGLEFETATFWGDDVFEKSNSPENWLARTRLAKDTFEAAMRIKRLADPLMLTDNAL